MILCLDIGNTQILGGVFEKGKISMRFRCATNHRATSDEYGVFFRNVLRENNIEPNWVDVIGICSVVPAIDYSMRSACYKYFKTEPFFLKPGVKTGLKIKYHNPKEVGADRIANAVAATEQFPNKNLIIIDLGTASVFCAVSKEKEYLGGAIFAGFRISIEALKSNTAKLFPVEIIEPKKHIGRSTTESIQAGLYYGQLGALKELILGTTKDFFPTETPFVIGTGGFSHLFKNEGVFDAITPDLPLYGMKTILEHNLCLLQYERT